MKNYPIGDVIRESRERLGVTQQELCEGICDVSSLSRIEKNIRKPSPHVMNSLLDRLGLPAVEHFPLSSMESIHLLQLQNQINEAMGARDLEKGKALLQQLEAEEEAGENYLQQYILRRKSHLFAGQLTPAQQKELLWQALRLTLPQVDLEILGKHLLSEDEMNILSSLAALHRREGDNQTAKTILYGLLQVVERSMFKGYRQTCFETAILDQLSTIVLLEGQLEEGLRLVEQGIASANRVHYSEHLGELLSNKAYALYQLGNKEEGLALWQRAICVMAALGHTEHAQSEWEFVRKECGVELERW